MPLNSIAFSLLRHYAFYKFNSCCFPVIYRKTDSCRYIQFYPLTQLNCISAAQLTGGLVKCVHFSKNCTCG